MEPATSRESEAVCSLVGTLNLSRYDMLSIQESFNNVKDFHTTEYSTYSSFHFLSSSCSFRSEWERETWSDVPEGFIGGLNLVYTKTVANSVFCALWFATQSVNIQYYSLTHLQFLWASVAKLALVPRKMASLFAAVTNKEISQIIKQAVPEISEEGNETRFGR